MRRALVTVAWSALCACAADASPPARFEPGFDAGEAWVVDVTASPSGARTWAVGGTEEEGVLWDSAEGYARAAIGALPLLHWAHAFGEDTLVAVGKAGAVLWLRDGGYTLAHAGTDQDLWGVWGTSADDVWAVGGNAAAEGDATLLHFDGASWAPVPLPKLARPHVWAFYKVWGAAADDVYVVGQSGAVLHYDGARFEELGLGTAEDLISVWGSDATHVAIVGGRSNGVLATFDGSRWKTSDLAPLPGLNGVWLDDGTLHVAGIEGTLARIDFASHAVTAEPLATPTHLTFHAIHGTPHELVAVGGNLGASVPPYRSLVMRRTREESP